jgi:hypothetical protein
MTNQELDNSTLDVQKMIDEAKQIVARIMVAAGGIADSVQNINKKETSQEEVPQNK